MDELAESVGIDGAVCQEANPALEEAWRKIFDMEERIRELNSRASQDAIDRRTKEDALLKRIRKLKKRLARRDKWIVRVLFDRKESDQ